MSLDLHVSERTVYTILDWLGDVGGLMGMLFDTGAFILMFVVGNGLSYMLIKEVFKEQAGGDGRTGEARGYGDYTKDLENISKR